MNADDLRAHADVLRAKLRDTQRALAACKRPRSLPSLVIELFDREPGWRTVMEVARTVKHTRTATAVAMNRLWNAGVLERQGQWGAYEYRLTEETPDGR